MDQYSDFLIASAERAKADNPGLSIAKHYAKLINDAIASGLDQSDMAAY